MTAWAYIAHKGGYWAGICSAEVSPRFLKKFFGEFAGFQIELVDSREAYLSRLICISLKQITHASGQFSDNWPELQPPIEQPTTIVANPLVCADGAVNA